MYVLLCNCFAVTYLLRLSVQRGGIESLILEHQYNIDVREVVVCCPWCEL